MRYDDNAYREVFPMEKPVVVQEIETPVETFNPSAEKPNTTEYEKPVETTKEETANGCDDNGADNGTDS